MISFFKNFGKGVLYVLVLPFLLVGLALYGVVAFFIFIFLAIKGLVLFFTGRSLYEDLPEDIEAKKRLAGETPKETTEVTNEDISIALGNDNKSEQSVNTADPFYVPEYLKSEPENEPEEEVENDFVEEPKIEEQPQEEYIEEPVSEPEPVQEEPMKIEPSFIEEPDLKEPEEDEIVLEKSEQKSNILEISDPDDEEEESSGVNIDFD